MCGTSCAVLYLYFTCIHSTQPAPHPSRAASFISRRAGPLHTSTHSPPLIHAQRLLSRAELARFTQQEEALRPFVSVLRVCDDPEVRVPHFMHPHFPNARIRARVCDYPSQDSVLDAPPSAHIGPAAGNA